MALDRTWYNTLVDDDGSGMTGSVWDKADVDSLMDAIDAELAKGAWTDFSFETYSASGGATVALVTANTKLFSVDWTQRRCFLDLYITVSVAGPAPAFLYIDLHTSMPQARKVASVPFNYYTSGAVGTGVVQTSASGPTRLSLLRDIVGTAWPSPANPLYLSLQLSYVFLTE
jgi:hypothetical protein